MNRKTAQKALALIVCVLFIVVTLFSMAFVLTHTHHEHDHDGSGGDCTTCVHLALAGNLLKLLAGALVCVAFSSGGFSALRLKSRLLSRIFIHACSPKN